MKTKLAVIITLAGCFLCGNIFANPLPGAIFTTDSTCTAVNNNIYTSKDAVYLNGGPDHFGALADGSYYVRVTSPGGSVLGTSIGSGNDKPFVVLNHVVQACYQLSAILIKTSDSTPGYDDTDNPGGEYKAWISTDPTFADNNSKTDNFKVKENPQVVTLCIDKFYDANANGVKDPGEVSISGWELNIVKLADDNFDLLKETPYCGTIDAGTYRITEGDTVETNWVHTTLNQVDVALPPDRTSDNPVEFGNVCLGCGGGLTLGFWSNKNGQSLETASDLCFLDTLNLVNANGSAFDPISASYCPAPTASQLSAAKTTLANWLLNAAATNMAYMLSAQLATMELNVRHNPNQYGTTSCPAGVKGSALVYGGDCIKAYQQSGQPLYGHGSNGFITINDLMAAANAELLLHPYTLSGSPYRAYQECLKTTLDQANNNVNFVQATPCPFTFSQ